MAVVHGCDPLWHRTMTHIPSGGTLTETWDLKRQRPRPRISAATQQACALPCQCDSLPPVLPPGRLPLLTSALLVPPSTLLCSAFPGVLSHAIHVFPCEEVISEYPRCLMPQGSPSLPYAVMDASHIPLNSTSPYVLSSLLFFLIPSKEVKFFFCLFNGAIFPKASF